jgi:hypothetical protein
MVNAMRLPSADHTGLRMRGGEGRPLSARFSPVAALSSVTSAAYVARDCSCVVGLNR